MKKEDAIKFAGLMEDYLNIPSFVCETIQKNLEEGKCKEVIEYVIQRRTELEDKMLEDAIDDFIERELYIEEEYNEPTEELENHMVIGEYYEND